MKKYKIIALTIFAAQLCVQHICQAKLIMKK